MSGLLLDHLSGVTETFGPCSSIMVIRSSPRSYHLLESFSHGASKCFSAPKVPLALEFEFDRRAVSEASVFSATKHSCHSILDIYRIICLVVNENCFDDMMLVHPSLHVDCGIDVAIVHIPMQPPWLI